MAKRGTDPAAVPGSIRCVVCHAPANTLTEHEQYCIDHAHLAAVDQGGWSQFMLRDRILIPLDRQRKRRPGLA